MRIIFCIVIAIPKEMSGKCFLKVSSKSDIAIMSILQIETLKFLHSSFCFTIPELVLLDQLTPDTNIFRTNLIRLSKFRTLKTPDHLDFGKMTILTVSRGSGAESIAAQCITIALVQTAVDSRHLKQTKHGRFDSLRKCL